MISAPWARPISTSPTPFPRNFRSVPERLRDDRVFLGGTLAVAEWRSGPWAASVGHYDGPWSHPDDYNSYNGTVRYTHGDQRDGFDLMAMAYHGAGNLTTDQPVSAFQQGLISRFGTLN